jgi:hypothetical protein
VVLADVMQHLLPQDAFFSAHSSRKCSRVADIVPAAHVATLNCEDYSTVTLFARFRGWSTSVPFNIATWYASSCSGTVYTAGAWK